MTEHLGGPESPSKLAERHEKYLHSSRTGEGPMYVIVVGAEETAVGSIGYWKREWRRDHVLETGWSVLPEFQGMGVATSAARLIVERAKAESNERALHAFPSVENAPSNRICEKVGFKLLGQVDFEYPPGHTMRCNDWSFDLRK